MPLIEAPFRLGSGLAALQFSRKRPRVLRRRPPLACRLASRPLARAE